MAGHKKAVAVVLVLVITCMLSCSARPLQPSVLSPTVKRHNQEEGRVHIPVQPDDVAEIKVPHKRIDMEMDDLTKSSIDSVSDPLKRMTLDVAESFTNHPVFAMLPKGPVPPSGPSTGPPCYNPEECHD